MVKVVERSGLGQKSTYLPKAINPMFGQEPKNDMATAMLEAKAVMCGAVEELLTKTGDTCYCASLSNVQAYRVTSRALLLKAMCLVVKVLSLANDLMS